MKPQNHFRVIALAMSAVSGVCLAVFIICPGEKEPEYAGKRLSDWLAETIPSASSSSYTPDMRRALDHFGTNALPWLVKWIKYENPVWKDKVAAQYEKWPPALINASFHDWLVNGQRDRLVNDACLGFQILGSQAAPAVPELIEMLKANNPRTLQRAIHCLGAIGPKARSALPYLQAVAPTGTTNLNLQIEVTIAISEINVRSNGDRLF